MATVHIVLPMRWFFYKVRASPGPASPTRPAPPVSPNEHSSLSGQGSPLCKVLPASDLPGFPPGQKADQLGE